jgi:hypothetical protein
LHQKSTERRRSLAIQRLNRQPATPITQGPSKIVGVGLRPSKEAIQCDILFLLLLGQKGFVAPRLHMPAKWPNELLPNCLLANLKRQLPLACRNYRTRKRKRKKHN